MKKTQKKKQQKSLTKKRLAVFCCVTLAMVCILGGFVWKYKDDLAAWCGTGLKRLRQTAVSKTLAPDPKRYEILTHDLESKRAQLAAAYKKAKTSQQKKLLEQEARTTLETTLPEMMRCWLGTKWDFNGTAAGPGQGKIACGYFVATVLKDAGFQVDRYRLAQQASGTIMRSFLEKADCKLTVGKAYEAFAEDLKTAESGIYLLGLDSHVAFLVLEDGKFRMLHSSGSCPWCVVDEGKDDAEVLKRSSWRMFGNLTANPKVLRSWMLKEKITVPGT